MDPDEKKRQLKRLNQLLLLLCEDEDKSTLDIWINISNWLRQSRLEIPPVVIILQRYLRTLQALEAGEPISITMAEFRKRCRPLVQEQAKRIRSGLPTSSIDQLLDEIQALLSAWGADYYQRSQPALESAISLAPDPNSKAEQRRRLDELMQILYSQQLMKRKHKDAFLLWPAVTSYLEQHNLDLATDEVVTLCYFQALDNIADGVDFSISVAWMRKQCRLLIKKKAKLLADGLEFSCLYEDVVKTLEEKHLDAEADNHQLLDQQETADEAFQSLTQDDQEILRLRLFEELPYKSIRLRLLNANNDGCTIEALRQRVSRAIRRLKRAYFLRSRG